MKKIVFRIQVDNGIDLITNSSSELFILEGKTKEMVEEMISFQYPNWRNEYDEIKRVDELSVDELDSYFSYMCSAHRYPHTKNDFPILDGFTFEELYEPESDKPAWNGEIQYKLKNNIKKPKNKWEISFVTKKNHKNILSKLSPNNDLWFLYSKDENPNWDMQERLMEIGERIHMG